MYNEPGFFDTIYALISKLMKQKLRDRVSILNINLDITAKH